MWHWIRGAAVAVVVAGLGLADRAEASAQEFGGIAHAGTDVLTITGSAGGFFPLTDFDDGTEFDASFSVGATATYWVHHFMGLRGNLLFTSVDVSEPADPDDAGAVLAGGDPTIIHSSGDAVVRLPLPGGETVSWFPYALAGLGVKHYRFEETDFLAGDATTATDFALNLGAGLEIRWGDTGRWGLNTEIRDFISPFEVRDADGATLMDQTLQDLVWTAGISLNF